MNLQNNNCNKNGMIGVGLRSDHFDYFEQNHPLQVDWLEAITENHLFGEGRNISILEKIRAQKPLAFHGVSMSIAQAAPLNIKYMQQLKTLIQRFDPMIVSDHICYTGNEKSNMHGLLPFPYTEETLKHVCNKIDQAQNFLKRTIAFENLSTYFQFEQSTLKEWDFIAQMAKISGCDLLLDVNNVFVNSFNHRFDPYHFIDNIPLDQVVEIHLAGHTNMGDYLFDTHSQIVAPKVWDLYQYTIKKWPKIPTLIEWDEDIPTYKILEQEAMLAKVKWMEVHG